MEFKNVYDDSQRADAYARLEFPGTYYLAYRDLPEIIFKHVKGRRAIDFGCGTGRSSRFLQKLGFDAVGVDIAEDMITKAREIDPEGDYRLIKDGDFGQFEEGACDLVLSVFTFDNIPTEKRKVELLQRLAALLKSEGRMVRNPSCAALVTYQGCAREGSGGNGNNQVCEVSGEKVGTTKAGVLK